jgi:hypothetical protein
VRGSPEAALRLAHILVQRLASTTAKLTRPAA